MDKSYIPWQIFGFGSSIKIPDMPKNVCAAKKTIDALSLKDHEMNWIFHQIYDSLKKGLDPETREESSIKPLPTYVKRLPTGNEEGKFLAIDLGGTNMRVLCVQIKAGKIEQSEIAEKIPQNIMTGTSDELFDFIAMKVEEFLKSQNLQKEELQLGLTFSFPVEQTSLNSGILLRWTKGFDAKDAVGKNVCELLQDAFHRRKLKLKVDGLLNDTTACLVAGAFADDKTRLGVIVGTGCNACYVELTKNIGFLDKEDMKGTGKMVLNTEWGSFGEKGELESVRTKWDIEVDQSSPNEGQQVFEKLISGMYLGDLVRCVLKDLAKNKLVFTKINSLERLDEPGSFQTPFVCHVESDPFGEYRKCRTALKSVFGAKNGEVTDDDCAIVRMICERVVRRACMLLASGLAALMKKTGKKEITISADGTLFQSHPVFYLRTREKIIRLLGTGITFEIIYSEHGSGVGSALVVAAIKKKK